MSDMKRIILIIYLVLLCLACVYVPWLAGTSQLSVPAGYSFVWSPPQRYEVRPSLKEVFSSNTMVFKGSYLTVTGIDTKRLMLEITAITAIAGIIFLTIGYKNVD